MPVTRFRGSSVWDPVQVATDKKRRIFSVRFPHEHRECCICLDDMHNRRAIVHPCGHAVHAKCDSKLRGSRCPTRRRCPLCRARTVARPTAASRRRDEDFDAYLDNLVDLLIQSGPESLEPTLPPASDTTDATSEAMRALIDYCDDDDDLFAPLFPAGLWPPSSPELEL